MRARGAIGSAREWHSRGCGFKPHRVHHFAPLNCGAPRCKHPKNYYQAHIAILRRSGAPRSFMRSGVILYYKYMYYVYILKSLKDKTRYMGITIDLKRRLQEHNYGSAHYSRQKRPYILAWYCAFANKRKAYDLEKYLKSSSGYAFMKKRFL